VAGRHDVFRLGAEAGLHEVHPVQAVEIPILLHMQRQAIVGWRDEDGLAYEAARKILHEIPLH